MYLPKNALKTIAFCSYVVKLIDSISRDIEEEKRKSDNLKTFECFDMLSSLAKRLDESSSKYLNSKVAVSNGDAKRYLSVERRFQYLLDNLCKDTDSVDTHYPVLLLVSMFPDSKFKVFMSDGKEYPLAGSVMEDIKDLMSFDLFSLLEEGNSNNGFVFFKAVRKFKNAFWGD